MFLSRIIYLYLYICIYLSIYIYSYIISITPWWFTLYIYIYPTLSPCFFPYFFTHRPRTRRWRCAAQQPPALPASARPAGGAMFRLWWDLHYWDLVGFSVFFRDLMSFSGIYCDLNGIDLWSPTELSEKKDRNLPSSCRISFFYN